MPDIIQLLPDAVANQIAAGEVIQRPSSVVKELTENSVDSGATEIAIITKEGGKNLIQVIDNGCGMSPTDSRMAFERHATSKIRTAQDLFTIRTMGFRGEALASIASVAEVEVKTKRQEDEVGSYLRITGNKLEEQVPTGCDNGTSIQVKNLFFNIPARRKFLKTNTTELKNIITEFQRIALSYPNVQFKLYHNDSEIYNIPAANIKQRIVHLFGKSILQHLVNIETSTPLAVISGYVGKPEAAKKKYGEQFFFVNKRFIKHPYLHRAIMNAFEKILPPDTIPSYFIYFEVPSDSIDINIHPTKTEVKFEDEPSLWHILRAAIRESLGKFNIVPSLDFETGGILQIPTPNTGTDIKQPGIEVNTAFDPFRNERSDYNPDRGGNREINANWKQLYEEMAKDNTGQAESNTIEDDRLFKEDQGGDAIRMIQVGKKYIMLPVKSGLMVIDQKRAHQKILYERYLFDLEKRTGVQQVSMFPQSFELSADDHLLLMELKDDLKSLGFEIGDLGKNTVVVSAHPSDLSEIDTHELLMRLIYEYRNDPIDPKSAINEKLANSMAKASGIDYGKSLSTEEMKLLVDSLFGCANPNYSPSGKKILYILSNEELEKNFK